MYIPADGHVFSATDYAQLELCALAQHCKTTYGKSKLAEVINDGTDVHKFLASKIYNIDVGQVTKDQRQLAKAASFGLPGGLAARTFVTYAKGYGVDIDEPRAQEVKAIWLKAFPEMEEHLKPISVEDDYGRPCFTAVTLTGRKRSNATYCEACNYVFQGLKLAA
jgi:DNA polymerase-1